ncbi:hypothetical protein MN608_07760 [Microdochium nivale]|nr:hypothetical protein MN608_07760 [Microdochium nivale]
MADAAPTPLAKLSFLDLPNELLSEVVRHAMPESFGALLLTCRILHECAKPLVPLYQSRTQAHGTLEVDARTDRRGILLCLDRIAQEPDILRYVTTADLSFTGSITKACRPSRALRELAPYKEFERVQASTKALYDIQLFIERSPCLVTAGIDTNSWARLMLDPIFDVPQDQCDCNFDSIENQVFMLSALKNVRTLRIDVSRSLTTKAEPGGAQAMVLDTIKNLQAQNPFDAPLRQLRTLLSFPDVDYDTWKQFVAMGFFLTTPSLAELYASSAVALEERPESIFTWPASMPLHHNLRRIELVASCFDDVGLAPLLAGTPFLETFRFGYAIKHHGQGYDYNPAELVEALRKYVGSTLKHLAMTLEPHFFGSIVNGVVDMHGLARLETLEIDYRMFYGPALASGERNGSWEPSLPTEEGGAIWTPSAIPPLIKILPSCLQQLELFIGESPSVGADDRFDQDASLHALFAIPKFESSPVINAPQTTTLDGLPPLCTIRCVNGTLSTEVIDFNDLRLGWPRTDYLKDHLVAMGAEVHVSTHEDPTWVSDLKKKFKIETW